MEEGGFRAVRSALCALVVMESAIHALAEAILAFPLFEVVSSCYKSQWGSGDGDALADVVSQ
jgi:hypothetical protein